MAKIPKKKFFVMLLAADGGAYLFFPAELADYAHVVHDAAVSVLCLRALYRPDETLIGQSPAFLLFGLLLLLLGQSFFPAVEDEPYLFHRAAYLHRFPLEPERSFFRDVLVGFF